MIREFLEENKISIFVKRLHCNAPLEHQDNFKRHLRYGCLLSKGNRQIAVYLSFGSGTGQLTVEKVLRILALDTYLTEHAIDHGAVNTTGCSRCHDQPNRADTIRGSIAPLSNRTERATKLFDFLGKDAYEELLAIAEEELQHLPYPQLRN